MQKIVAFIPAWLTDGLNLGSKFLTAYGIALLLSTMLNRDLTVYFLLGFFFVGYLGLDVTAVAIFAAILAVVADRPEVWQRRTRRSRCRCSCCQCGLRPAGR